MARRRSLTARMADQLDTMALALEALLASVPVERPAWADPTQTYPLSPHQGYAPSVERLAFEARLLVAEQRLRAGA